MGRELHIRRGCKRRFIPTKRGGGRKSFSYAEGGTKGFEVVLTRKLEVLAIGMGGAKRLNL